MWKHPKLTAEFLVGSPDRFCFARKEIIGAPVAADEANDVEEEAEANERRKDQVPPEVVVAGSVLCGK